MPEQRVQRPEFYNREAIDDVVAYVRHLEARIAAMEEKRRLEGAVVEAAFSVYAELANIEFEEGFWLPLRMKALDLSKALRAYRAAQNAEDPK